MKKDRLKTLLYNAIVWIEEENGNFFASSVGDEYKWFEQALGITKDEMKEISVDWLKAYENDVEDDKDFVLEKKTEVEM